MSRQERFWDEQIRGALKERAGEIKGSQGETEQACRKIHRNRNEEEMELEKGTGNSGSGVCSRKRDSHSGRENCGN